MTNIHMLSSLHTMVIMKLNYARCLNYDYNLTTSTSILTKKSTYSSTHFFALFMFVFLYLKHKSVMERFCKCCVNFSVLYTLDYNYKLQQVICRTCIIMADTPFLDLRDAYTHNQPHITAHVERTYVINGELTKFYYKKVINNVTNNCNVLYRAFCFVTVIVITLTCLLCFNNCMVLLQRAYHVRSL